MRAETARTATCALEIEIGWQDGAPLRRELLSPPRSFYLKDGPVGDGEAAFAVSSEWLGSSVHELVSVSGEHVVVRGVALGDLGGSTSCELKRGESAAVVVGPLQIHVRVVAPVCLPLGSVSLDPKRHTWTAASVALHALMLGAMAMMPPRASSLSLDAIGADDRYAKYLATPVMRDEELPWTDDDGLKGQGEESQDAARDKGDEGKAGKLDAPQTNKRMGIVGNDKVRRPAAPTSATAGTAGILGVLSAQGPVGPVTDVWNAKATGYDPVAALGDLFGNTIGDNGGFHGLGLRGTGRHGGGDVEGAIGIGKLQTGKLARGMPGSRSLAMRGREGHVPVLRMQQAEVKGSLSKEAIRRVIHRNLAQVRSCFEEALSSRPDLAGRLAIQFMISPSGVVQHTAVAQSSLGSPQVESCVAGAVRRWSFPAPDGGGYVSVSYPFVFERVE